MSQEPPEVQDAQGAGTSDGDERMWAMLCHLSTFSNYIGIPGFVGPLVIWLVKKDESPFVEDHGKEALNFQITTTIVVTAGIVLLFCFLIGLVILIPWGIFATVVTVIAAVKANEGEYYRYPLSIRLIN